MQTAEYCCQQRRALARLCTLKAHILPPGDDAGDGDSRVLSSTAETGNNTFEEKEKVVMVVMIGWLGAKERHLKRYEEWYSCRGIHVLKFLVEPRELFFYELGGLERRMCKLGQEVAAWVAEKEEDGRGKCLVFHTFSNAGWLVYGTILDYLQRKHKSMDMIKGCVVDSGAGNPFNPKVWAAGSAVAFQRKLGSLETSPATIDRSREIYDAAVVGSPADHHQMNNNNNNNNTTLQLFLFEKLYSLLLDLPRLNRTVTRAVSSLTKNQPYPQLYLYSTADKLIPFRSIETFMEEQRRTRRKVFSFNFESSPHVDHYRNFPTIYSSQLRNFFKLCF